LTVRKLATGRVRPIGGPEVFSIFEKVRDVMATRRLLWRQRIIQMKRLSKTSLLFIIFLLGSDVALIHAQNDPQAAIAKKQAELERQRLELERKSLELKQKELDLEKARQDFQAQQSGRSLSMNLSGDVLFDYDKAALKPAAEDALKKVAVVLGQFPESKVTVEGYTDSKGTTSVNMQLSRDRAQAVKDWLVKNGGVLGPNIATKGFGEQYPIAANTNSDGTDNPIGRALNRRVTIIVEKPAATAPPTP
jgi:outer membrane protein OmpA-like peptidoglycan-associated protein